MKKVVVVAVVAAGLAIPTASAGAETVPAPVAASAAPVGSSSEDVFCAVLRFLKGGWAGRPADCSF
ncbi:hypothetical protein ABZ319_35725 [Nocardia sp. NPDC005978]|uniref:hypothetical protein n=1 Tax=Nocardia sp. NPDC005978 TaxID=3156725 RepID=UPI0033A3C333